MPGLDPFDRYAERYDQWFERHPHHYNAELRALRALMPQVTRGIEMGVGTFADLPFPWEYAGEWTLRFAKRIKNKGQKK